MPRRKSPRRKRDERPATKASAGRRGMKKPKSPSKKRKQKQAPKRKVKAARPLKKRPSKKQSPTTPLRPNDSPAAQPAGLPPHLPLEGGGGERLRKHLPYFPSPYPLPQGERESSNTTPRLVAGSIHNQLRKKLEHAQKIVVVGIGNELRGDDAAGLLVAERLEKRILKSAKARIAVVMGGSAPENVTGFIRSHNPSHVILVDAAELGEKSGTVRVIDPKQVGSILFSTHTLPLTLMVSYLKHELGCEVIVIGIQPANTDFGAVVSKEIAGAAEIIAASLAQL